MAKRKDNKTLAENRKARHDYFVDEAMEAGIALVGTEVKSIRNGRVNLKDCYADINNGEIFINNMHISPYEQGNIFNVDPLRKRKLLLHKSEIQRLIGIVQQQGVALIPLSLYLKNGRVKVNLGVWEGFVEVRKTTTREIQCLKRLIRERWIDNLRKEIDIRFFSRRYLEEKVIILILKLYLLSTFFIFKSSNFCLLLIYKVLD